MSVRQTGVGLEFAVCSSRSRPCPNDAALIIEIASFSKPLDEPPSRLFHPTR